MGSEWAEIRREIKKMSGSLADRITKTLIYGKRGKSDIDLRIGLIKRYLIDFAKEVKSKKIHGKKSNIMRGGKKFKRN